MDDAYQRYVHVNLPHARTIAARIGRTLTALGAFGHEGNGAAVALQAALLQVEKALEPFDEDPPESETLLAADGVAELGRELVRAILDTPCRNDRLGQLLRNLFECLGLGAEGADLSLKCGERPDSPLR